MLLVYQDEREVKLDLPTYYLESRDICLTTSWPRKPLRVLFIKILEILFDYLIGYALVSISYIINIAFCPYSLHTSVSQLS